MLGEAIYRTPELMEYINKGGKIVIVAHSMGGLVARSFIEQYGIGYTVVNSFQNNFATTDCLGDPAGKFIQVKKGDKVVSALITLATPHHGSPSATKITLKMYQEITGSIFKNLNTPGIIDLMWDDFDNKIYNIISNKKSFEIDFIDFIKKIFDKKIENSNLIRLSQIKNLKYYQYYLNQISNLDEYLAKRTFKENDTDFRVLPTNSWLIFMNNNYFKNNISTKYYFYAGSIFCKLFNKLNILDNKNEYCLAPKFDYYFNDTVVPSSSAFLDREIYSSFTNNESYSPFLKDFFTLSRVYLEDEDVYNNECSGYHCRFFLDYDHSKMETGSGVYEDENYEDNWLSKDSLKEYWTDIEVLSEVKSFISDINNINSEDLLNFDPLFLKIGMDLEEIYYMSKSSNYSHYPQPYANDIYIQPNTTGTTTIYPGDIDKNDNHTFEIIEGPYNGIADIIYDNDRGILTYTPDNDFTGIDYVTVEVTDLDGLSKTLTINIFVNKNGFIKFDKSFISTKEGTELNIKILRVGNESQLNQPDEATIEIIKNTENKNYLSEDEYEILSPSNLNIKFNPGEKEKYLKIKIKDNIIYDNENRYLVLKINSSNFSDSCTIEITPKIRNYKFTIKWIKNIGASTAPAISSDGTIYLGGIDYNYENSYLYALEPDGTEKWEFQLSSEIVDINNSISKSVSILPAIGGDGTIYLGGYVQKDNYNDTYNYSYYLYAIAPDGTEKWEFQVSSEISTAPVVGPDGTIYFGTTDGTFYALYPEGVLRWNFKVKDKIADGISIDKDGTIYFGAWDNYFYALKSDGSLKWKYKTGGNITETPLIDSNGVIYFSSTDNYVYALKSDGTLIWKKWFESNVKGSLTMDNEGILYVVSGDNLYAIETGAEGLGGEWSKYQRDIENTGSRYGDVECNRYYAEYCKTESECKEAGGYWYKNKCNIPGKIKWIYETFGDIITTPAINSDGSVYFGSRDNYLYALNPDGTQKWKFKTDGEIKSSPTIGNNAIYFGSGDSYFYALNIDGSLQWKFNANGDIEDSCSIGPDGTIYFGSGDNYFYALNPDGSLKWKFETSGNIKSSPVIGADGTIYFGSEDNYFYALNPDGSLEWKYKTNGDIESFSAIDNDGTIYFGSGDNYLYALNPDGSLKWKFKTNGNIKSSPVIGIDGTIYFSSEDGYIYALNKNGDLIWTYETEGKIIGSPVIGKDNIIYFGSEDNYVYALNSDGTLKWKLNMKGSIESSLSLSSDGTLYFGVENSLFAIDTSSKGLAKSVWPKYQKNIFNNGTNYNEATCNKYYPQFCDNETDCINANGYWYNNQCNKEPDQVSEYQIIIKKGWNLKALPVKIDNGISIETFNKDGIITVWKWIGTGWKIYTSINTVKNLLMKYNIQMINKLNTGEGFWVNASKDVSVNVNDGEEYGIEALKINEGWNLLGIGKEIDSTEFSDFGEIKTVWKWAGSNWEVWSPIENIMKLLNNYGITSIENIEKGEGFWINK